jgi:membrane fusion protein (multidrug efflux system)
MAVHVQEGQRVRRGDVLVELDPRAFEMALREAQARLASARIDFSTLAFNDSTPSAEKRDRMAARTGVTEAEQRVARAQMDLDAARIIAPFDGEIVSRAVNVGERAQPERPLVTIVDRSRIRVPAEVLEASFAHLSPGAKAAVRFPALGGTRFEGRITALSPELDTQRGTGIAYVEIVNDDGRIKPGMYCEVEIEAARFDNRLAVPRAAVLERSRRLLVFLARRGRAEWAYVDTGLETDDRIEITHGITAGDTVLVDGHLTLAHGAPVSVSLVTPSAALP